MAGFWLNPFQKKPKEGNKPSTYEVSKKNDQKGKPSIFYSNKRQKNQSQVKTRVFKPKNPESLTKLNQTQKDKPTSLLTPKIPGFFNIQKYFQKEARNNYLKSIRYFLFKYQLTQKINQTIGRLLLLGISIVLIYVTFFDTFFLIKTYTFGFSKGSYLSPKELDLVSQNIRQNYFLGVIPSNQYWYLNERNLTIVAKKAVPEIESVTIDKRNWPDGVNLKISQEPILVTLALSENGFKRYWRISQKGRVITEDVNNIAEKVVTVDKPVSFNRSGVSFQDYPLEENQIQVERLWAVLWLVELLENPREFGMQIVAKNLPSISDTEINLTTANGTKLFFESDIQIVPKEIQRNRIKSIFKSNLLDAEKRGEIAYIDFRIPNKKVFVCYRGRGCEK